MSYLVDTNVLSELTRRAPDPGVLEWAARLSRVYLSVVSLEEICFGLSWKPNPRVILQLEELFAAHCDVLPVTEAIARKAGSLRGRLQAAGKIRTQADMFIAATAEVHGLTLITRNVDDFAGCGLQVVNPFTG
jgi:predicted nucleic acid-binding protein